MKGKVRVLNLIIMFFIISIFGVGYVEAKDSDRVWDIHFNNVNVTEGSVVGNTLLNKNKTSLSFNAPLQKPGDFYEFSINVINNGSKDAVIDEVSHTSLTDKQQRYLKYTTTYSDGTSISKKDVLKSNEEKIILVRVEYKKDITASDLPTETEELNLELNINYVEK